MYFDPMPLEITDKHSETRLPLVLYLPQEHLGIEEVISYIYSQRYLILNLSNYKDN